MRVETKRDVRGQKDSGNNIQCTVAPLSSFGVSSRILILQTSICFRSLFAFFFRLVDVECRVMLVNSEAVSQSRIPSIC